MSQESKTAEVVSVEGVKERIPRKKRLEDSSYLRQPKVIPGGAVVCLSRLPHGFYENELRAYLSQFGDITRLRLSRNPRTGASRHYAFVEFKLVEVAKIVVDTMHNYLLSGHLLQATLVQEDKVHQEVWKGANRKFVHIPWRKMECKRFNGRTEAPGMVASRQKKLEEKRKQCQELGMDYDFTNVMSGELAL